MPSKRSSWDCGESADLYIADSCILANGAYIHCLLPQPALLASMFGHTVLDLNVSG